MQKLQTEQAAGSAIEIIYEKWIALIKSTLTLSDFKIRSFSALKTFNNCSIIKVNTSGSIVFYESEPAVSVANF